MFEENSQNVTLVLKDHQVVMVQQVQNNQAKMEVCKYQKYGFCKFRDSCNNQHLSEICENLSACANIKSCPKRHPEVSKSYALEKFCKFESCCAYHHKEENTNNEINKKVVELEKIVDGMFKKIGELENKIKVMASK